MKCKNCQKGLRGLISTKLGRCTWCMQVSALGTLIGWMAALVVYFVTPALLGLSLFVAASFTLLWIAHIVALIVRGADVQESIRTSTPEGKAPMGRREFVPALGRVLALFGALGFGVLGRPQRVGAQSLQVDPEDGQAQIIGAGIGVACEEPGSVRSFGCSFESIEDACKRARRSARNQATRICKERNACAGGPCIVARDSIVLVCKEEHEVPCCDGPLFVCCCIFEFRCRCSSDTE